MYFSVVATVANPCVQAKCIVQMGTEYACRRLPTECRQRIAEALPYFAVIEQPAKVLANSLPDYLPAFAKLCRDDLHDLQSAVGTLLGSTLEPCIFIKY